MYVNHNMTKCVQNVFFYTERNRQKGKNRNVA